MGELVSNRSFQAGTFGGSALGDVSQPDACSLLFWHRLLVRNQANSLAARFRGVLLLFWFVGSRRTGLIMVPGCSSFTPRLF